MSLPPVFKRLSSVSNFPLVRTILFILFILLILAAFLFPYTLRTVNQQLVIGDVVQQDIQAPRNLTYSSDILTEEARKAAEDAVTPVYFSADPGITRTQIEKLQQILNYITVIRADIYATPEQKLLDLAKLVNIHLDNDIAQQIISLDDSRWSAIQQEALRVIEQVMRNTIRESNIIEAKKNVPSLISYSLSQEQAGIVASLVTPLIVTNSLYSQEQTTLARNQARSEIQPVSRSFITGETIINRGQIITPLVWEALDKFGLLKPQNDSLELGAVLILVASIVFIILQYAPYAKGSLTDRKLGLALIETSFLIFLYGARLVIPNRTIIPYLYPLPAFGLTIGSLYSAEIGIISSLLLSVLSAYGMTRGLELTIYFVLSTITGIFTLKQGRHIGNYFWSGIAIGITGAAVILFNRLPDNSTDWIGMATLIGAAFFNGVASASITLLLRFVFAQALRITTPLQLLEISRPDHPLLHLILREAPGTYQHSLQVANLAEQAAEAIGADSLLTRVGALFHDSGKTVNPSYFIENQPPGQINPHETLDPVTSSKIIIQHVTDGIKLAQKYHVPLRIQDFIREHHGTLMTRYQYTKAVEAAGNRPDQVDANLFRYPGPKPNSRETALVMLADGCEARVRAELPTNEEQLVEHVKKVFEYCQQDGQLDQTLLTLRDLNISQQSFIKTLQNTYHNRIKYPDQVPPVTDAISTIKSELLDKMPIPKIKPRNSLKRKNKS